MRGCCLIAAIAILFGFGVAHASPKADVQTKIKEAMENYDLMDYDAARKLLNQALAIAKKSHLDKDPVTAKAHLSLGIVHFVNQETDAAKLSFLSAVQIDPKIDIDPAYKSDAMGKLLEQVRQEATGSAGAVESLPTAEASDVDCTTVQGLKHEIVDTAPRGAPLTLEAYVALDVTSTKVSIMYRPEGSVDYTEVQMQKQGDCKYTGAIPASAFNGSLVHYYIAAYNDGVKPVAARGSSGSPNIIEVSGAAAGGALGDSENPLGGGGGGGSVSSGATVEGPHHARVMIAIAGGTGFGYVTGTTEGDGTTHSEVKNCCLGSSLVVLQPEIGYYINPQLSVSVAARIGIPIGANVMGHATVAPGGLARVRYAFSKSGDGLRVMGQIGAGIMRNTIKLDNSEPGMDTDIVAQGPLLVGGGIGFTRHLSSSIAVMADLSALAAIAVVDSLGAAPVLNNGFGADLSLGIQLGF